MAGIDDIQVAVIGAGRHGRDLINYALDLPGVRFKAVCDIWPYNQRYAAGLLKKRGHPVAAYEDYRDLLAGEKGLDAAIVATPDSFHAEQAAACLKAGLHVYLEKEMATTLEGCREVVRAARAARKLCQVGRQHRSNPRYHAALEYLRARKAVGRITHVAGQWHGHKRVPTVWPKSLEIDPAVLRRYGFASMDEHRNWRWLSKFSAGELVNLGAHQLDVFNWFLGALPKAVLASGGLDYYEIYELHDNATCLLEWDYAWEGKTRTVRGLYNVLTTTDDGGFYEAFIGNDGVLGISEDIARGGLWREPWADRTPWEGELPPLFIGRSTQVVPVPWDWLDHPLPRSQFTNVCPFHHGLILCECQWARLYPPLPSPLGEKAPHWYHLKNFFDAIRGAGALNCPAEVGYQAAVTALKAVEAMKAGRRLTLKPEDFTV